VNLDTSKWLSKTQDRDTASAERARRYSSQSKTTTANRKAEVESAKVMVERVEERFEMKPKRLIDDTAYGTAKMLGWMVDDKAI